MLNKTAEGIHTKYISARRVRILAQHLAALMPREASVLDVGCGDGAITQMLGSIRPDLALTGVESKPRKKAVIPVQAYDGIRLPYEKGSYDVVLFVDSLHHADDPKRLLCEGGRVARKHIVIKDHTCEGWFAEPILRFMDRVGNARHGVSLPNIFWPRGQWVETFKQLRMSIEVWESKLKLYPFWANWLFGRSLHFIARTQISK
jgi:SAM-dependent methyltransferase